MNPNRLEPVLVLLAAMVVLFTALLIFVAKVFPMDGQTFQVVSGLVTGFSGAFLMRVKPRGTNAEEDEDALRLKSVKSTKLLVSESIPPADDKKGDKE